MRVRHPDLDFSGMRARWASNTPVVQTLNAIGIVPAHIEPYLIRVLRAARAELDPEKHPRLIEDIDIFVKQEAQHLKLHTALNKIVRDDGYPGMAALERAYAADYARFLETKSLRWNVAYCEGFEALGSAVAGSIVDGIVFESLDDADPRPILLWQWHLAEEFEHRTVVFRTFHALYGHQPVRAWLVRCIGLVTAGRHIGANVNKLHRYLRQVDGSAGKKDRPSMQTSPGAGRGLLRILSPRYDPATLTPPRNLQRLLDLY